MRVHKLDCWQHMRNIFLKEMSCAQAKHVAAELKPHLDNFSSWERMTTEYSQLLRAAYKEFHHGNKPTTRARAASSAVWLKEHHPKPPSPSTSSGPRAAAAGPRLRRRTSALHHAAVHHRVPAHARLRRRPLERPRGLPLLRLPVAAVHRHDARQRDRSTSPSRGRCAGCRQLLQAAWLVAARRWAARWTWSRRSSCRRQPTAACCSTPPVRHLQGDRGRAAALREPTASSCTRRSTSCRPTARPSTSSTSSCATSSSRRRTRPMRRRGEDDRVPRGPVRRGLRKLHDPKLALATAHLTGRRQLVRQVVAGARRHDRPRRHQRPARRVGLRRVRLRDCSAARASPWRRRRRGAGDARQELRGGRATSTPAAPRADGARRGGADDGARAPRQSTAPTTPSTTPT